MTHAMIPKEQKMKGGLKDVIIRISVGLERARDLVDDLRKYTIMRGMMVRGYD